MSSTWVAEFENKKDYKHFLSRFEDIAPEGGNVIVPDLPENPGRVRQRGAFISLDETVYDYSMGMGEDFETGVSKTHKHPAWAISFDIAIWDNFTKDFIMCIFQEMCHRYKFVEIGCTSSKLVSQEEFLKWKVLYMQKEQIKILKENFNEDSEPLLSVDITYEKIEQVEKEILDTEKKFREAAKRFFDGDASDLILMFDKK